MTRSTQSEAPTTIDLTPIGSDTRRAWVVVLDGGTSRLVELPRRRPLSVGRSRSSGVVVDHHSVSRLHATLEWDGGTIVHVKDLGSRNGTFVHGERVDDGLEVGTGASITVGCANLSVVLPLATVSDPSTASDIVAADLRSKALFVAIRRIAATPLPVLLMGETGVGKDLCARHIHETSPRRDAPFVAVNCGAIPETMAESALFGHERGAFTGADRRREGFFEAAHGGTLLLDEIGELSAASQTRLLRTLESGEVTPVGSTESIEVDVRVVAATHRDLGKAVEQGSFRQDLLYRLDVLRIEVPPLRERPDDILPLAIHLLAKVSEGRPRSLGPSAERLLRAHDWPGNVRELRNVLARAATLGGEVLRAADFDLSRRTQGADGLLDGRVSEVEKAAIVEALEGCGQNQTRAARRLGITRRALIYRMEKHGLKPPAKGRRDQEPRGE